MKRETRYLSTGETVDIFDDVFEYDSMYSFQEFFQISNYSLTARPTSLLEHQSCCNFQSIYSSDDIDKLGIFKNINQTEINEILNGRRCFAAWVLVTSELSRHFFHKDQGKRLDGKTFLYYGNVEWNREWGGETIICNNKVEPEIIIQCKPNRVVIFDSELPHKPVPISPMATTYRFTFVAQFNIFNKKYHDEKMLNRY